MKKINITMLCLVLVFQLGCQSEQANNQDDDQISNTDADSKTSTMLDTQMDALEKAKGVEDSLKEFEEMRNKKMQEQGI